MDVADVGKRDERLDRLLAVEVLEAGVAPNAALAWARREGAGWSLRLGGEVDRIFDLASVTKPITAVAAARAIDAGALSWSATVGSLLPELASSAAADARLVDLLAHRAGLPAWGALQRRDPWSATTATSLPDDGADVDLGSLLARAASRVERTQESVYSDLGYVLAGAMIARAVSEPLARQWERVSETSSAARRRAADPSFDLRVVPTEDVAWRGGVVRGEVHDENAWFLERAGGDTGHAGAFGTVREVARFAMTFVDRVGQDDPRALEMIAARPGGTHRIGWDSPSPGRSSSGSRYGHRAFGHLGFTGTSVWADPDAGVVAVLLTNRVCPTRDNVRIREARPRIHDALWSIE